MNYELNIVSVPKASIHKDAGPVLPQHQIRMPWQLRRIMPITKSPAPQPSPHNPFRLRILRSDSRHNLISLLRSEFAHKRYSYTSLWASPIHKRIIIIIIGEQNILRSIQATTLLWRCWAKTATKTYIPI